MGASPIFENLGDLEKLAEPEVRIMSNDYMPTRPAWVGLNETVVRFSVASLTVASAES